uniref:FprA family A-type flavoprotein n=1 Tax=Eubacterium cellulosolvens TaxID=29322 RepID=UPI000487B4D6|nr:FprA family A-type flavoprotein [[Eubacterium] cellulosolvens]
MYNTRKITDDLYWVGASDRRLALFENVYPIPDGISYNSYLLMDEKTVLIDTVDNAIGERFFENVGHVLGGRKLDYIIVNHVEPDHSATLQHTLTLYPEAEVVCSAKAKLMLSQFFTCASNLCFHEMAEGDVLSTGRHELTFFGAPMVHWPEVMFTFDTTDGTLFSADAFGTFGALSGNIFADEVDFENKWMDSARRYYANIVGKYGPQVTKVLRTAADLAIRRICPLHGPVWRENIDLYIDKYTKWASYTPEEPSVLIIYGSIYGHTQNAADIVAAELAERGVRDIAEYDVSVTDASYIVAEAFRRSHIVIASATYNNEIFTKMEQALLELSEHALQNRTVAVIENGSWAPQAGKKIRAMLEGMKNITVLDETVTIKSALKDEQRAQLTAVADAVAASVSAMMKE